MSLRHFDLYRDLVDDLWPYLNWYFRDFSSSKTAAEVHRSVGERLWIHFQTQTCRPEAPLEEYRAFALASTFLKKFKDVTGASADDDALRKFRAANIACSEWVLDIQDSGEELLYGLFKQELYRFLNYNTLTPVLSNLGQILAAGKTGPGASVGARGSDFYTKLFSSPLTCTSSGLYTSYVRYLCKFPEWNKAETLRSEHFGEFEIVPGNRLTFVPKNVDTSRVICIEPNLNMFLQQGIKAILEKRLIQYFGIDLSNQPEVNRELARKGSANDSYCTIDLSSASDSVSRKMLQATLPSDFLGWLEFVRSPTCTLPNGEVEQLHMISSMGNATTFPLQTIIFACVVSAAYSSLDIEMRKGYRVQSKYSVTDGVYEQITHLPNFGVFGDDIIVEKAAYARVVRLLNLLGFTINAEKSFNQGPFRESCGGDYFRGHNTRGVYIKSLRTPASRYVAINRLNQWSSVSGLPLRRTIGRLQGAVRYLPVPLHEDDDAGIKMPLRLVKRVGDWPRLDANQSYVYRRWSSIPKGIKLKDGIIKLPKGTKSRITNPSALLLAFLRGDIDSDFMSIRLGAPRYCPKVALSLNWDFEPTVMDGIAPIRGQTSLASSCGWNLNRF